MRTRSAVWGAIGTIGMATFYAAVIIVSSGWSHLGDQVRQDWYFIVPIVVGFGVQVALMVELRHRHRMRRPEIAAGASGAGASTVGMLACCAHHLVDVAPFVGATALAGFLADSQVAFVVAGLILNAVGITVAARRLHREPAPRITRPPQCLVI